MYSYWLTEVVLDGAADAVWVGAGWGYCTEIWENVVVYFTYCSICANCHSFIIIIVVNAWHSSFQNGNIHVYIHIYIENESMSAVLVLFHRL